MSCYHILFEKLNVKLAEMRAVNLPFDTAVVGIHGGKKCRPEIDYSHCLQRLEIPQPSWGPGFCLR